MSYMCIKKIMRQNIVYSLIDTNDDIKDGVKLENICKIIQNTLLNNDFDKDLKDVIKDFETSINKNIKNADNTMVGTIPYYTKMGKTLNDIYSRIIAGKMGGMLEEIKDLDSDMAKMLFLNILTTNDVNYVITKV